MPKCDKHVFGDRHIPLDHPSRHQMALGGQSYAGGGGTRSTAKPARPSTSLPKQYTTQPQLKSQSTASKLAGPKPVDMLSVPDYGMQRIGGPKTVGVSRTPQDEME